MLDHDNSRKFAGGVCGCSCQIRPYLSSDGRCSRIADIPSAQPFLLAAASFAVSAVRQPREAGRSFAVNADSISLCTALSTTGMLAAEVVVRELDIEG